MALTERGAINPEFSKRNQQSKPQNVRDDTRRRTQTCGMTKNRDAYLGKKNVEISCVKIPYGEGAIFVDSHAVDLTAGTAK